MTHDNPKKCSYCGVENDTVSHHSGNDECSGCWNYRKLDRPAALHWAQVTNEFLSNVDPYDMMTYLPKALEGGSQITDWGTLVRSVQRVMRHSERVLKDGPYHVWKEEVKLDPSPPTTSPTSQS